MKVKRVKDGVYASIDERYAIIKTNKGEWKIYEDVGKADNRMRYVATYKLLADAKRYIENIE